MTRTRRRRPRRPSDYRQQQPDSASDYLADEIREYYIPDFSRWKEHDAFEETFARLLRDLKAEGRQPAS